MDRLLTPKPLYSKYRYAILGGALLLALIIYISCLALRPRTLALTPDQYTVAEVQECPFSEYIDVEGVVLPIQTIQVNSKESGTVERIVAEEGTMLKAGDTILVLSNPELLRSVDDERAEWENSRRNYSEQEIEMERKSITLRQQTLDANHEMKKLEKSLSLSREEFRMGIKSRAELDIAEEEYDYQHRKTQLQLQSLRHDSVSTRLKREIVNANRTAADRKLQRAIGRTSELVVRAAVAGQLSYLNVTIGQQVSQGVSIGEIKVLSSYKVRTLLSEYYIDRIMPGLPAYIRQDDKRWPLRVSKVVPEVKDRKFTCDLVFTGERPSNLRLGKSFRINIELGSHEHALVIPRGDFYQHTSGTWIYRLSADSVTVVRTPIETGRQNPQQHEILSGLKAGDRVIVSGYGKLGDNDEIRLK